jgi:hypothetical protein
MPLDDYDSIRLDLKSDPNLKWGFVVYRCTYGDEDAWNKFIAHLDTRVRLNMIEDGCDDLYDRIDWCVQEDPALDDASYSDVRS